MKHVKIQCDSLRIHKTDRSDTHKLAITHFSNERRVHTIDKDVYRQLMAKKSTIPNGKAIFLMLFFDRLTCM